MADGHYLVLARKWRPQAFDEVVGQDHITRTLRNALNSGRIGHAFLFIGSRGIGKTTTARILAKCLNCSAVDSPTAEPCGTCDNCTTIAAGNNIDVIEIDGASNNSVDDVRQIRENVRMVPSGSRYKIYIIDEVHQLSSPAFNALLKTLEEPPPHAVFIMATTEAHKIPATIISRCQRYDFRRVGLDQIVALLRHILEAEGVRCSDEALHAIARSADGGVRDAESILDQLISYCGEDITFQDVFDVLGLVDWSVLHELCGAILDQDVSKLLVIVDSVVVSGKDLSQFVQDILRYFRNLLVCKSGGPDELLALPDEQIAEMRESSSRFTLGQLIRLVEQFAQLTSDFDSQLAQRTALEAMLIGISKRSVDVSLDSVLEKIAALGGGEIPAAPAAGSSVPAQSKKKRTPLTESEAPPDESTPIAIVATESNLDQVWQHVVAIAGRDSMNLATWLPAARPVAIQNDSLILEFRGDQDTARAAIDKPVHRERLESALRAGTQNLTTFRTTVSDRAEAPHAADTPERNPAVAQHVDPDQGLLALENPRVAKVVDVFKGRIVDIQAVQSTEE